VLMPPAGAAAVCYGGDGGDRVLALTDIVACWMPCVMTGVGCEGLRSIRPSSIPLLIC
jgi:hypothetical protein